MAVAAGYKQSEEHVKRRVSARLATLMAKPKPVSAQWLEQRYASEKLDCTQIGRLLARDPKTVWSWLRHYGIPTRPRGTNHAQLPKDGSTFLGKRHTQETRARLRAIALLDGRVPFNPKVGPPMRGKRGAEAINWKGGITPERQAFYSSPQWRAACCAVWARADARCERCGLDSRACDLKTSPFHVHHIVGFAVRDLRAALNNLALLCKSCHHFVHSRANLKREFL